MGQGRKIFLSKRKGGRHDFESRRLEKYDSPKWAVQGRSPANGDQEEQDACPAWTRRSFYPDPLLGEKELFMSEFSKYSTLNVTRRGESLTVQLSRPQVKNAFNEEMIRELDEEVRRAFL